MAWGGNRWSAGSVRLFRAAMTAARAEDAGKLAVHVKMKYGREKETREHSEQRSRLRSVCLRYGLAAVIAAAAMGLRLMLSAWVGAELPPYITFYPAVMLSALLAGFGPGLATTALAGVAAAYWILPPGGQFLIDSAADRLGLLLFSAMGLFMSTVTACYRGNLKKAGAYDRETAVRASEERLRFAMETSHVGVWSINLDDYTVVRSREHDRIFGYAEPLPDWTYQTFLAHVLPEDRALVEDKFRRALQDRNDWNVECRIRRADGAIQWIWMSGRQSSDSDHARRTMAGIVQDITERKQAAESLRQMNDELERRVAERTMEIQKARETLEQRVAERAGEIRMANADLASSRRAALNIMDDAIQARKQTEQTAEKLAQQAEALRTSNNELLRFNRAMVDRELRLIELKKEVNELRMQCGQPPAYKLDFEKDRNSLS